MGVECTVRTVPTSIPPRPVLRGLRGLLLAWPLLLMLLMLFGAPARSEPDAVRIVEGQRMALQAQVAGADLQLNGTGVRAVAWFKGYVAALYLPAQARTLAQVLGQSGPKRLQLRMLQDVPAQEFVKALNKGVARNATPAQWEALAPAVKQFDDMVALVGTVRKGDVIDIDLEPARGLLFSLNGKLRGDPVEGGDLYAALLRAFLGDKPYDDKLKAGLLSAPLKP